MPADLDRKADGTAAMFSVGETPWHQEGTILLSSPKTVGEALELAGLNFDVDLRPVYTGSKIEKVKAYMATVRSDTGAVLGIVGSRYTPLQNRDGFRVLEPLLDSGKALLETGGALRGGRDVWILVRFVVDDPVIQEVFADEVVPFGLLSNNHAGIRGVTLQETPIRVVCSNTLGMAHRTADPGRSYRVRHTIGVERRTIEAATKLWSALIERYRVICEQYRALRNHFLEQEQFQSLVLDVLTPIRPEWRESTATKVQRKALDRAAARRHRLQELWKHGRGHAGEGTAWEAYNGAVQSLDHDVSLWPARGGRLDSMFDGSIATAKQRVLDGLYQSARQKRA